MGFDMLHSSFEDQRETGVLPDGSPPVTWEQFATALEDQFIPWSVNDKSRLRFESQRQDGLLVTQYEARFCQFCTHGLAIVLNETQRIRRFVRGLTFSIRSAVFHASREGSSFQSIMSAAKEAELIERDEFGELKRAYILGQFHGASCGENGGEKDLSYLAFTQDTSVESPHMYSVPVVKKFLDVFPSDLPGFTPNRDMDFAIYLEPGTKPISIPLDPFMELMNEVFRQYVDSFVIVFIDDILLFSKTKEDMSDTRGLYLRG
nr:uncharacterized protein LOC109118899 [Solanum lycopersicum]